MMTNKNTLAIALTALLLPSYAFADGLPLFPIPLPPPVLFDNVLNPIINPDDWQQTAPPTFAGINNTAINIQDLSTKQLQEINAIYAEDLITLAIADKNWQVLNELLAIYGDIPKHDVILHQYATGAILRSQGRQKEAIHTYRGILARQPDLPYVKLDLALMLTEDKQFKEADQLLAELQESGKLTLQAHNIVSDFRKSIKDYQAFKPSMSLNYEATDNVNNASSTQVIEWLGRQWQKNEESLPQTAHGIRYALGVTKQTNLTGNHNFVLDVDGNGVYYWDNKAYNEQSVRVSAGYKYQDIDHSVSVLPFAEQNWLDGEKYVRSTGVSTNYTKSPSPKSQWQVYGSHSQKSYHSPRLAERYDGNTTTLGTNVNYILSRQTMVYGGLDGNVDNTLDKSLASNRYGVRAGISQSFDGGLGVNASVRYAYREFKAPSTLVYNFARQDDEYQAGLSLWHKKIAWQGLRPQANIRYNKIDSNMPAFYSRSGLSYFINIQKDF